MTHIPQTIHGEAFGFRVFINGEMLDPTPSQRVFNHSPDGFAWGYGGSGPAQLALALLLKVTFQENAFQAHQDFKREVVAHWPRDEDFHTTLDAVQEWYAEWKYNLWGG